MDNLIEALDAALLRAGLSDAAASQAAVGNASAIKNLRMQRGAEKRYNYVTLQKLADLLDLELYFGPRRSDIPQGQGAGFMEVRDPALFHDLPRDDANRQFLPLPFSSRAGADRGVAPIAFMRGWFIERDLAPDNLRMVRIGDDSMAPALPTGSLVVVDEGSRKPNGTKVMIVKHNLIVRACRLTALKDNYVAASFDHPDVKPEVHETGGVGALFQICGTMLWSSHEA